MRTIRKIAFDRFYKLKLLGYIIGTLALTITMLIIINDEDYLRPDLLKGILLFGGVGTVTAFTYIYFKTKKVNYPIAIDNKHIHIFWPTKYTILIDNINNVEKNKGDEIQTKLHTGLHPNFVNEVIIHTAPLSVNHNELYSAIEQLKIERT